MLDGLRLDPYEVLGLRPPASPEAIRQAYHLKSKKHHPDNGGDAWAFRIVTLAYRTLSEAAAPGAAVTLGPVSTGEREQARLRPGVRDQGLESFRIVAVEVVWSRLEVGDFLELLRPEAEDRNLEGAIRMTWPDPAAGPVSLPPQIPAGVIHRALNAAFDDLRARTGPKGARSEILEGGFAAELTYPNGPLASEAFKRLHVSLRARGLGVRQWTRDITVARGS